MESDGQSTSVGPPAWGLGAGLINLRSKIYVTILWQKSWNWKDSFERPRTVVLNFRTWRT
jgi:hypothetical protein